MISDNLSLVTCVSSLYVFSDFCSNCTDLLQARLGYGHHVLGHWEWDLVRNH